MDPTRRWVEKQRSVEECLEVLRSLDTCTLRRRVERLSLITRVGIPFGAHLPNRTNHLFDEAEACFTNGEYNGCVTSLAAAVEHGLRELLDRSKGKTLCALVRQGVDTGFVGPAEGEVLLALTTYRNKTIHSDIDHLAFGIVLHRQAVNLTHEGMKGVSDWEEFNPETQTDKEIAADLSAEKKAIELLVKTREIVFDIFDRHSLKTGYSPAD